MQQRLAIAVPGGADTIDMVRYTVAIVRYGPGEVGAAHLIASLFYYEAVLMFDASKRDGVVDLTIGSRFKELATPTEMRQVIALKGRPQAPPC